MENWEPITLLTAWTGLITALVGGLILIWKEIRGVHIAINSRMDELLELTRKTAHEAGVAEGEEGKRKK
jgi:hypothetical protein